MLEGVATDEVFGADDPPLRDERQQRQPDVGGTARAEHQEATVVGAGRLSHNMHPAQLEERRYNDCTFDQCDHERDEDHIPERAIGCGDAAELIEIYEGLP